MVVGDVATGAEVVVIGAGPGGYTAAIKAARKGKDVVLVDKEDIGGTCLNRGCIPAKALIQASMVKEEIEEWEELGIDSGNTEADLSEINRWKNEVVDELTSGVEKLLESAGVEIMRGKATFQDSETLRVEEEHDAENIEFEKAVIAAGSRPVEIPGFDFDREHVLDSRQLLNLEEVPEELVVIGGGYIGLEAATELSKLGCEVKIVEEEERILGNFDRTLVRELKASGKLYSENVYTGARAESLETEGKKAVVKASKGDKEIEVEGDKVLVAVGRTTRPVIDDLNLSETDIEVEDGFIQVDSQMQTTDSSIFAIGDIVGHPMLAHKAYREAKVVSEVLAGGSDAFDSQYIPKVVFTEPEIATVGLSPEEAEKRFDGVRTGRFPFSASGRSLTTNSEEGFVRVVATEEGKLEGVQIIGPRASDMIAEATLALEMQAYLDDVARTIHAHPTFPEAFMEACEDAMGEAVHKK